MAADPDADRFGPRRSDPNHANPARMYDYMLGGNYHYPVDQIAVSEITRRMPLGPVLAKHNRMWVQRAVRYLVTECNVRQFLDIGSGIPTFGNVHEVAQQIAPTTRVVYVDYERVAVDIALEILESNPYATSLHADMRQPDTILENPTTNSMLDFTKPIAMIWGSMLHFIEDRDDPFGIFARYKERLKPGDYIALTHLNWQYVSGRDLEQQAHGGLDTYKKHVPDQLTIRDLDAIMRFFDGTQLVDPGLVPVSDWKPDLPHYEAHSTDKGRTIVIGGVGRVV